MCLAGGGAFGLLDNLTEPPKFNIPPPAPPPPAPERSATRVARRVSRDPRQVQPAQSPGLDFFRFPLIEELVSK